MTSLALSKGIREAMAPLTEAELGRPREECPYRVQHGVPGRCEVGRASGKFVQGRCFQVHMVGVGETLQCCAV